MIVNVNMQNAQDMEKFVLVLDGYAAHQHGLNNIWVIKRKKIESQSTVKQN